MKRPFDGGQMITSWLEDLIGDLSTHSVNLAEQRSERILRDLNRLLTPASSAGSGEMSPMDSVYPADTLGFGVDRIRLLRDTVKKAIEEIQHDDRSGASLRLVKARNEWVGAMRDYEIFIE